MGEKIPDRRREPEPALSAPDLRREISARTWLDTPSESLEKVPVTVGDPCLEPRCCPITTTSTAMLQKLLLPAGFLALATPGFAAVINSGTEGLLAPDRTVTFSEHTFADNSPVLDEFADVGVTFSTTLFYRTASAWEAAGINGINIRSGNLAGDVLAQDFSIRLDAPVISAAFASIASPVTPATITARLNGVDVESFTTEINLENNSWYGFTDVTLDEIAISYSAVTRIRIDNIQTVVPEPSTSMLVSLGVLFGLSRHRRRK